MLRLRHMRVKLRSGSGQHPSGSQMRRAKQKKKFINRGSNSGAAAGYKK